MGKYANYVSDKYPTETAVEEVVLKHTGLIKKFFPDITFEELVFVAKNVEFIGPDVWTRQMRHNRAVRKKRELENALAKAKTPKNLARYIAFQASEFANDLMGELPEFARDGAVAVATFQSAEKVRDKRESAQAKKESQYQNAQHMGGFTSGTGPGIWHGVKDPSKYADLEHVFQGSGFLGGPIMVVKKGTDLKRVGLSDGTLNGNKIKCFEVPETGFRVIKAARRPGRRPAQMVCRARRSLPGCAEKPLPTAGAVNRTTSPGMAIVWRPDGVVPSVGVTVQTFKGLYVTSEQYEVIDPLFDVSKHFVKKVAGIGAGAGLEITDAPAFLHAILEGSELVEVLEETGVIDAFRELASHAADIEETGEVEVLFEPVGTTTLPCIEDGDFVLEGWHGRGLRIGDIEDDVLALADF
jgi:hypothetical protein